MAGNVQLKGGPSAEPTFTDNGTTLTAAGNLVGLGNGDILVTVSATLTCTFSEPTTDGVVPSSNVSCTSS